MTKERPTSTQTTTLPYEFWKRKEFQDKLKEFHDIDDRDVALTLNKDPLLPLDEALQIHDLDKAHEYADKGELKVLLVCFNDFVEVKVVEK